MHGRGRIQGPRRRCRIELRPAGAAHRLGDRVALYELALLHQVAVVALGDEGVGREAAAALRRGLQPRAAAEGDGEVREPTGRVPAKDGAEELRVEQVGKSGADHEVEASAAEHGRRFGPVGERDRIGGYQREA